MYGRDVLSGISQSPRKKRIVFEARGCNHIGPLHPPSIVARPSSPHDPMPATLASYAARPLVRGVGRTRRAAAVGNLPAGAAAVPASRVGGGKGIDIATARFATLRLARSADDLRAGASMTSAARQFRAAADVSTATTRTSHR